MTPDEFYSVLTTYGFEVKQSKDSAHQLRVVCRVPLDQVSTSRWLQLLERLLLRSEHTSWDVDCSKQYFMRGSKLTFGWRLIFQGDNIVQHLPDIAAIVSMAPAVTRELDEVRLHARPNRNALSPTGKGVQGTEGAIVGPLAHQQLRPGG